MRAELSQLLVSGQNGACSCGWGKDCSDKYKLLLSKYGPMDMLEVTVAEVIKKMDSVSCEDRESAYHSGGHFNYFHEARIHSETFPGKLEAMEKKASICLDCVRIRDAAALCRFQHK